MKKPIRIILVDDIKMFREGIKAMLGTARFIECIGEAADGSAGLRMATELKPDVVITDIQMPDTDGIELTRELKSIYPAIPVIALTMFKDDHLVVDMLEAGAKGYVLKSAGAEQVVESINSVHAGGWYFCDSTSLQLSKMIAASATPFTSEREPATFTDTEKHIITMICEQHSSREIAAKLFLGERTVENYRFKIFEKMAVKNMAGMVIYAIRHGLYKP